MWGLYTKYEDKMHQIKRRQTSVVDIGGIPMGSDHPIRIQSMTNTVTHDVQATVKQIQSLADAGSEYVRITENDLTAAQAVPEIVHQLIFLHPALHRQQVLRQEVG